MSMRSVTTFKVWLYTIRTQTRTFTTSAAKHQSPKPAPSTPGPQPPASPTTSIAATPRARLSRLNARLPPFLQSYTTPLLHAPTTHITSFLLLHELTAVIPLFGFAGLFYYSGWSPSWIGEWKGVDEGVQRFTKYFRRKGWIGEENEKERGTGSVKGEEGGKEGVRVVLAFATAYAITKAFLPLRLIISVWATPWFARLFVTPLVNMSRSLLPASRKGTATAGQASTMKSPNSATAAPSSTMSKPR